MPFSFSILVVYCHSSLKYRQGWTRIDQLQYVLAGLRVLISELLRHESLKETDAFLPARTTANESDAHIYYQLLTSRSKADRLFPKSKMSNTQNTERINEHGEVEKTVETVDYRVPAGKEEPSKEKVGVVHLVRDKEAPRSLTGAATAVADTARSAKDALLGKTGDGAAE